MSKYFVFFKESVKNSYCKIENGGEQLLGKEKSCHHIISNIEIIKTLTDLKTNYSPKDRRKILENYINKPHIANIIITKMFDQTKYKEDGTFGYSNDYNRKLTTKGLDGRIIHATFSWNPHNLVYGPGYKNNGRSLRGRASDRGSSLDIELYDKQNESRKKQIDKFYSPT